MRDIPPYIIKLGFNQHSMVKRQDVFSDSIAMISGNSCDRQYGLFKHPFYLKQFPVSLRDAHKDA